MPTIEQCKFCNMPFHSVGGKICPNCLDHIDEAFISIRDYIYYHPGNLNIDDICAALDIKKKIVLHLLQEKRLTITTPQGGALTCSVCNKPIQNGTMCDDCKQSISSTLASSVTAPPKTEKKPDSSAHKGGGSKMHVRGDDNRGSGGRR